MNPEMMNVLIYMNEWIDECMSYGTHELMDDEYMNARIIELMRMDESVGE